MVSAGWAQKVCIGTFSIPAPSSTVGPLVVTPTQHPFSDHMAMPFLIFLNPYQTLGSVSLCFAIVEPRTRQRSIKTLIHHSSIHSQPQLFLATVERKEGLKGFDLLMKMVSHPSTFVP